MQSPCFTVVFTVATGGAISERDRRYAAGNLRRPSFMNCSPENAENPPDLAQETRRTVWLVIPSFNDSPRLMRFLPALCSQLENIPLRVMVQVVDDGSSQEDQAALERLICETQSRFPFVCPAIFQGCNQGKGAAILRGWEAGNGADWLGFLDADGAVSAGEVARILEKIQRSPDSETSLFASRVQMRGRTVERSLKRHLMGRIFATLVGTLIDSRVYDSQCGFKLLPSTAYRKVKPLLQEKRFAFDVELLAALNREDCPIEEIPVDWSDVPGSKVSLFRDSLRMFFAVRLIRLRMRTAGESLLANRSEER